MYNPPLWTLPLYLGTAEDLALQLLHLVDLDIDLVCQTPGLLHLLEELLHVTCNQGEYIHRVDIVLSRQFRVSSRTFGLLRPLKSSFMCPII